MRGWPLIVAGASLLTFLVLLAACGGDDDSEALSPEEAAEAAQAQIEGRVIGTWEFTSSQQMQLNEDGSFAFFGPGGGSTSIDEGQYEVEENLITFGSNDDSTFCAGMEGQYQMDFLGSDTLNLELVEDECGSREGNLNSAQFLRTSG